MKSKKKVVTPKFNVGDVVELQIVTDISRGGQVSMETGLCRILVIEKDQIVVRQNRNLGLRIVSADQLRILRV